jgi:hydrogenase maturation protease
MKPPGFRRLAGERALLLAWGNPGRRDDGLGPLLADVVAEAEPPDVTVVTAYQLGPEHAEAAARHDLVIFADASRTGAAPFETRRAEPRADTSFTTHALSPEAVLQLAATAFGARPRAWILGIRGAEFDDFGEEPSPTGRANLAAAAAAVIRALETTGDRNA